MTKAITQTYSKLNDNLRIISYTFLIGCLILVVIYSLNLFKVISNTVAVQQTDAKMTALSSSVDQLDSEYLSLTGNINPDNLGDYGMTKGKVSMYISKVPVLQIGYNDQFNHVALINER